MVLCSPRLHLFDNQIVMFETVLHFKTNVFYCNIYQKDFLYMYVYIYIYIYIYIYMSLKFIKVAFIYSKYRQKTVIM